MKKQNSYIEKGATRRKRGKWRHKRQKIEVKPLGFNGLQSVQGWNVASSWKHSSGASTIGIMTFSRTALSTADIIAALIFNVTQL